MVSEEVIPESFTKCLARLGIIAALVEGFGIVDLVNARLPRLQHRTLTHGDVVLALILNGLGFTQRWLYLFSAWFENKPLERLFGKEVTAADITDDVIGRTLDAIEEYGPERLYQEIISQIFLVTRLGYHQVHLDITSFNFYGASDTTSTVHVAQGYPEDGRWGLNRSGLGLIVNQAGVPLSMRFLSDNGDDKVALPEMLARFRSRVEFPEPLYYIADPASYVGDSFKKIGEETFFITLVPGTTGEQQALLRRDLPLAPMADPRYSFFETESCYGGVHQKWVVYHSAADHAKQEKALEKRRSKEDERVKKALAHLNNREFACEADALAEAERWIRTYPLYEFESVSVVTRWQQAPGRRGRPEKDGVPGAVYLLAASVRPDEAARVAERAALGRFVLATNDLDLAAEDLLARYGNRGVVEHGFRFLNDSSFTISDLFLENNGRIEALGMMMTLMLAVYSLGEYQLRRRLEHLGKTVPDRAGKPTAKPTLKWVMTFFDGVVEYHRYDLATGTVQYEGILNMSKRCWDVVEAFGPICKKYYS
ncbi:MAG TPA: IS1634 family transposase [Methanoculleus sp.]|nr:IS1634 family transposase [Methanoculleus sp.]